MTWSRHESSTGRAWGQVAIAAAFVAILAAMHDVHPFVHLLGGVVLYNRLDREGQFENDTRRRIFDRVRDRPGQSIAQIATTVGVSHSTASYHLERLMEFNLLAATPDGNKMRFFINGGMFTDEERRILAALSNAETCKALACVIAHPGCYRAELSTILGVSSPTVNWHLARLIAVELVREEHRGRNRYLFANVPRARERLTLLIEKVAGTSYEATDIERLVDMCNEWLSIVACSGIACSSD